MACCPKKSIFHRFIEAEKIPLLLTQRGEGGNFFEIQFRQTSKAPLGPGRIFQKLSNGLGFILKYFFLFSQGHNLRRSSGFG